MLLTYDYVVGFSKVSVITMVGISTIVILKPLSWISSNAKNLSLLSLFSLPLIVCWETLRYLGSNYSWMLACFYWFWNVTVVDVDALRKKMIKAHEVDFSERESLSHFINLFIPFIDVLLSDTLA